MISAKNSLLASVLQCGILLQVFLLSLYIIPFPSYAETNPLADSGVPVKKIVYSSEASATIADTASKLAALLEQMTGGSYTVETFTPANGPDPDSIVLGLGETLAISELENPSPQDREHYWIGSSNDQRYIILAGTTELAVTHAAFRFLYLLGCRWYFASPDWSIIPFDSNLAWITSHAVEHTKTLIIGQKSITTNFYRDEAPDYKARNIWFSYCNHGGGNPSGEWLQNYYDYLDWSEKNKNTDGLTIKTAHNYHNIVSWAKDHNVWDDSYYALIDGVRDPSGQLCVSNPGLQQVCIDYALDYFSTNPDADCVSMEPDDHTKWCECSSCNAIQNFATTGFVTDRVVYLANIVANAIPSDKYVGMLAYSAHNPPPSITACSNVYVLITTGYLKDGYSVEQLVTEWGAKAAHLGIYDYFSITSYDRSLPCRSDVTDISYLNDLFPGYYPNNVNVFNAQASHAFGGMGLGYYTALRLAWDINENIEDIKTDFLTNCFGNAADTMKQFYERIDKGNGYRCSEDLIGRLFRYLNQSMTEVSTTAEETRLRDLALWLRYCELCRGYIALLPGTEKQAAAEAMLRHAWKIRGTNMVDSLAIWRTIVLDSGFEWPLDGNGNPMDTSVPMGVHPWKESTLYTTSEIDQMIQNGIGNNDILPTDPKVFGSDLVPSGAPADTRGSFKYVVKITRYSLFSDSSGQLPSMTIMTGKSYQDRGDSTWELRSADGATLLQSGSVPPDQQNHTVSFSSVAANTSYLLVYDDHGSTSEISWASGSKISVCCSLNSPYTQSGAVSYRYFYVPKGTNYVMMYAWTIGDCTFYNAADELKHTQTRVEAGGADVVIPVDGDDDQIWYVKLLRGTDIFFYNIPGLMANSPDELLIPEDALPVTPDQLEDLAAWYDASDTSTITESNSMISAWNDKSDNEFDLLQAAASKQPLLVASALNGNSVVRFDGVDDIMTCLGTDINQSMSVFLVFKRISADGSDRFIGGGHAGIDSLYLRYPNTGDSLRIQSESGDFMSVTYDASDYTILALIADGDYSEIYRNGLLVGSGDSGIDPFDMIVIGGRGTYEAEWINMDLAECIIYNPALNLNDRGRIENYLSEKWGITLDNN